MADRQNSGVPSGVPFVVWQDYMTAWELAEYIVAKAPVDNASDARIRRSDSMAKGEQNTIPANTFDDK